MSKKVFSDKMIDKCVTNLLPNKVIFALGDKYEVECASIWITRLQEENEKLRSILRDFITTKVCRETWIEEMHATILDQLDGDK